MARSFSALPLAILGIALSGGAQAQGRREVPIERDLRREQRIEQRLEDLGRPVDPNPNATPDNPDGVVGFDGPPNDGVRGVVTGGPLPPGSPSDPN